MIRKGRAVVQLLEHQKEKHLQIFAFPYEPLDNIQFNTFWQNEVLPPLLHICFVNRCRK